MDSYPRFRRNPLRYLGELLKVFWGNLRFDAEQFQGVPLKHLFHGFRIQPG